MNRITCPQASVFAVLIGVFHTYFIASLLAHLLCFREFSTQSNPIYGCFVRKSNLEEVNAYRTHFEAKDRENRRGIKPTGGATRQSLPRRPLQPLMLLERLGTLEDCLDGQPNFLPGLDSIKRQELKT